jgi:integrase
MAKSTTGVQVRHSRGCPAATDRAAACRCKPSYRAEVYDARSGTKLRKTFPTIGAAKAWRQDAAGQVRRGQLRAVAPMTLREAAADWLEQAKAGTVRTRSGEEFKPSTLRGYEAALERRVLDELGHRKLSDITRGDLQDFADRLLADGLDASTIRNCLMPLRAIYRRALSRGFVTINPTSGLELPAVQGRRDRIADPSEAALLLAALPEKDRAPWSTAMYAGLRRGELMALRWEDVDLARGLIRVERSWDVRAGLIEPKSRAGRRKVPIAAVLRDFLDEHKLATERSEGLVFGRSDVRPFEPVSVAARAATAWKAANVKRKEQELDPLEPITLHEARHTFASLMIAAGVNAKALSTYMGHASITITLDRYGHLMPGNEEQAAELLDAYLARADSAARLAQVAEEDAA